MNITGYKNKLDSIKALLNREESKKKEDRNIDKVSRLKKSKYACSNNIKRLQHTQQEKRNVVPRKSIKGRVKKGRRRIYVGVK